ncbi:hypothetical protein BX666DRAFT_1198073 [Dichotomocladium elegans]|nr:hypothetical protein BX666DRAFT_1198073 [Dichotomocladium elegans]
MITQWLEDTVDQCSRFMTVQQAMAQRNNDLCELKKTMEHQIERMENGKIDADVVMIQQFKEILNRKKRRIRQVMKERDRLTLIESSELSTEQPQLQPIGVETPGGNGKRKRGKQPISQPQSDKPTAQSGSETDVDEDEIPKTRRKVLIPR